MFCQHDQNVASQQTELGDVPAADEVEALTLQRPPLEKGDQTQRSPEDCAD